MMMRVLFVALMFSCVRLMACTGMLLQATDRTTVNGRTLEFGIDLDMSIAFIPRDLPFTGTTPLGKGKEYTSKYAAAGIYCFDVPLLMDGMNEKGLVAASFYFPGYASYTPTTDENRAKALSPVDFPHWILTQFATIDEVKDALSSVVIAPTVFAQWGTATPPLHYILYEPSGKSIVIEPLGEKLVVRDNPLGVITNSPSFDWHLTNLSNYANLSPINASELTLRTATFTPLGQGSGMLGLPGDFTPPSRFVRAAFFSATTNPPKNGEEGVLHLFHLLNQFDIPKGSIRQRGGDNGPSDYTSITSVKDPQALKYYFRTYDNQAIQYIDLHQFDPKAPTIQAIKIQGQQEMHNISASLGKSS